MRWLQSETEDEEVGSGYRVKRRMFILDKRMFMLDKISKVKKIKRPPMMTVFFVREFLRG